MNVPLRALVISVAAAALLAGHADAGGAATVVVSNPAEFRAAASAARPGTRIELSPGTYEGGFHFTALRGEPDRPITIAARDPKSPPVLRGAGCGLQLSSPEHVEVRGLVVEGQSGNGVNVDDGSRGAPAHHVVLADLVVRDGGPRGNCDGIKLSGLTDFRVEGCTLERWGTGGSGVDMVGCAKGVIERCTFRQAPGTDGSGVQMKGGTRDVAVRRSRFENAGSRAVNAGGSTGLAYFRPPLEEWKGPRFEAKDLCVEGCTFAGSDAPVAFVGVTGAVFRFNTVYVPGRWFARILQETTAEGFVACERGTVTDNLVVFRSDRWREGGVNKGGGTRPDTFTFARNLWFCADAPARTRALVAPPTAEDDGVYGKDPELADPEKGDFTPRAGGPGARVGATALPK